MPEIRTRDGTTYRNGRALDPTAVRQRQITTARVMKQAGKCNGCALVAVPRGAQHAACGDLRSENYSRMVTAVKACRRWREAV